MPPLCFDCGVLPSDIFHGVHTHIKRAIARPCNVHYNSCCRKRIRQRTTFYTTGFSPTEKYKKDSAVIGTVFFVCVRQNLVFEPIFDSVSNDFSLFTSLQSAELSNRSQLDISSLSSRFQLNAGICFVPRISDCRWVVSLHCKL